MKSGKKPFDYGEIDNHLSAKVVYTASPAGERTLIPEPGACKAVPAHLAREYRVVPVRVEGNKLIVAMSDPKNVIIQDNLRLITSMEIEPVQVEPEFIEKQLRILYGFFDVDKVCENLETEYGVSGDEKIVVVNKTDSEPPIVQLVNSIKTKQFLYIYRQMGKIP